MKLTREKQIRGPSILRLEDPPIAKTLFGDVRWAWLWLILRLYVGYEWLIAGWGKLNNPAWTGTKAGAAITGFVNGALSKTGGEHPDVQTWYAWFLQNLVLPNAALWSYLVTWGEILVGIALILGIFTGIAAFFGSFMNMNYLRRARSVPIRSCLPLLPGWCWPGKRPAGGAWTVGFCPLWAHPGVRASSSRSQWAVANAVSRYPASPLHRRCGQS